MGGGECVTCLLNADVLFPKEDCSLWFSGKSLQKEKSLSIFVS